MSTVHISGRVESSSPRRHRKLPWTMNALLWVSAAVLVPAVLITLALLSTGTLFDDAAALELAPIGESALHEALTPRGTADHALYQQKVDAKAEELPAQF